jgi:hypothetical protein
MDLPARRAAARLAALGRWHPVALAVTGGVIAVQVACYVTKFARGPMTMEQFAPARSC